MRTRSPVVCRACVEAADISRKHSRTRTKPVRKRIVKHARAALRASRVPRRGGRGKGKGVKGEEGKRGKGSDEARASSPPFPLLPFYPFTPQKFIAPMRPLRKSSKA